MNAKQIYERVLLTANISERQFFDRLNDTLGELGALYGEVPKLLYQAGPEGDYPEAQWVKRLDTDLNVLPLYHHAIVDNILFLSGAGEAYQAQFRQKVREAWLKYWNVDAKGRRVKRGGGKGGCCCV